MVFILHATLFNLTSFFIMHGNGHVIHQILSASMYQCFLGKMGEQDICEDRPLSACPAWGNTNFLRRHPSQRDQDCILSAGVGFQHTFAPNYQITTVVRQPQIHGPPLGLALYQSNLFRKCVQTNLPWAGFELGSLGLQAVMLPIEPTLLVIKSYFANTQSNQINQHLPHHLPQTGLTFLKRSCETAHRLGWPYKMRPPRLLLLLLLLCRWGSLIRHAWVVLILGRVGPVVLPIT